MTKNFWSANMGVLTTANRSKMKGGTFFRPVFSENCKLNDKN